MSKAKCDGRETVGQVRGDWRVPMMLALVAALLVAAGPVSAQVIPWRSGEVVVAPMSAGEMEAVLGEAAVSAGPTGRRHVVVQFSRPPVVEERAALRASGVTLLRYLGRNTFFAVVDAGRLDAAGAASVPGLRAVLPIARVWKMDPMITAGRIPSYTMLPAERAAAQGVAVPAAGFYVLLHDDVDLARGEALVRAHGGVVVDRLESVNGLVIEMPVARVSDLADEDGVAWVEVPIPSLTGVNDSNRARTQADDVQDPPYNLDGSGVVVLLYDAGWADPNHPDFGGRVTPRDDTGISDHATHVGGTIGGDGSNSQNRGGGPLQWRGMAPGVTIESYGVEFSGFGIIFYENPGDIEEDYIDAIYTYGAVISNNSLGSNVAANGFDCDLEGNYGVTSMIIDTIVSGGFGVPFRIVWANGNERGWSRCGTSYGTIAPPAGAKNHIAVGALNSNDDSVTSFTSWGPTDDGRMRPDVSAPGCQSNGDHGVTSTVPGTGYGVACGTSMASPTVTGLCALLLQDFRQQYPDREDPRNATLKVLLAHTAVDIAQTGPDYRSGYGSVRIKDAIDFMRTGSFHEGTVGHGETFEATIEVADADPFLKVTLAWDDVPGWPGIDPALLHDLDLRVFDPNGQRHYPWTLDPNNPNASATRNRENHLDNIEQVYVENPMPGTWRVEVFGFDVQTEGQQDFSLCSTPLLQVPTQPGDFDGDGDVDIVDFSTFAACFGGSGVPCSGTCCEADFDGDGDVDIADFSTFAANFTGSQ